MFFNRYFSNPNDSLNNKQEGLGGWGGFGTFRKNQIIHHALKNLLDVTLEQQVTERGSWLSAAISSHRAGSHA